MATKARKKPKGEHMLPPKKEFVIGPHLKYPAMYRIHYDEGGVVPMFLSGGYSSKKIAMEAIEVYESTTHTYLKHVRDKEHGENKD